jgi:hypothetical protein
VDRNNQWYFIQILTPPLNKYNKISDWALWKTNYYKKIVCALTTGFNTKFFFFYKTCILELSIGPNSSLQNRLCEDELGPILISKMVLLEPLHNPLGHLLSGFRYWATHHLYPRTKLNSVGCEGVCVKSLTSDVRWPEHEFISRGNLHLKSRFCRVEFAPTQNSKTTRCFQCVPNPCNCR